MEPKTFVFVSYAILGALLIIFNKYIAEFIYKLVLYFTDKVNINELFLFKVNNQNKDSLFSLSRAITLILGISIFTYSIYFQYFAN